MTAFVPYEVDYSVKNVSKTIGVSKKRINFKFGFANPDALRDGLEGSNCRGSEHEIVFVWSLSSGKRVIQLDGKDIHYSETGQNGWTNDRTFQHLFNLSVRKLGTFRCLLLSQPVQNDIPGAQRPFDFRINGISYFHFNHIYQLGTPAMTVRYNNQDGRGGGGEARGGGRDPYSYGSSGGRHRSSAGGGDDEPMSPEERRALAQARLESMRDFRKQEEKKKSQGQLTPSEVTTGSAKMDRKEESLISFDDDPPPPSMPQPQQFSAQHHVSSVTLDSTFGNMNSMQPNQHQYQQQFQQPPYHQNLPTIQQKSPPAAALFDPMAKPQSQQQNMYTPPGQNQYQPPNTPSNSMALTPYQPPNQAPNQQQQQQQYVDPMGRLAYGAPPPQRQQQPDYQPPAPWGTPSPGGPPSYPPGGYPGQPQQQQQPYYPPSAASFDSSGYTPPAFAQQPPPSSQQPPNAGYAPPNNNPYYGNARPSQTYQGF